jgi:hypothetical protein
MCECRFVVVTLKVRLAAVRMKFGNSLGDNQCCGSRHNAQNKNQSRRPDGAAFAIHQAIMRYFGGWRLRTHDRKRYPERRIAH